MQYILIHYGELALKGKNRGNFVRQLSNNLRQLLKPATVRTEYGRLLLGFEAVDDELMAYLALIPGIKNFSLVQRADNTIEAMQELAASMLREQYGDNIAGRPFAVRSRRGLKTFAKNSPELNFEIGGYLKETFNLQVNLDAPEITVHVEVAAEGTYIYTAKHAGIGGLPVGSSGHGIVLFSGGIDSPAAAYMMMKRGMRVTLVHLYNSTINRDFGKIERLAACLSRYQGHLDLYLVDLEEFQRHAIAMVADDYRMVIYKRQMIRSAGRIALTIKGQALVTGDSLGQVASQTLANIQAIYDVSPLPLLSPLIAWDKDEIIAIAQRTGTFEKSIEEYCDICSYLIAKHPQTAAKPEAIARFEAMLPAADDDYPTRRIYFKSGELVRRHDHE